MHLTLVLPNLLPQASTFGFDLKTIEQATPNLSRFLSLAKRNQSELESLEGCYMRLFNLNGHVELPMAAFIAKELGLDTGQWWCMLEPVACSVHTNGVQLLGNDHLNLDSNDMRAMVDGLQDTVESHGMKLYYVDEKLCLLSCETVLDVVTNPLHESQGKDVRHFQASGPDAKRLDTLQNDLQMQLHSFKSGELEAVNFFWLSGTGLLVEDIDCEAAVWANERPLRGIAKVACTPANLKPDSVEDWITKVAHLDNDLHYIIDNCLLSIQNNEDYLERLIELEQNWFTPLIEHIQEKALSVSLDLANGQVYRLDKARFRAFWRRTYPLSHFFVQEEGRNRDPIA